MIRNRVLVYGRVQGVFFRDSCRRMALNHNVSGWVRNLPDGRVEAVFEGAPEQVQRLTDWARHGPVGALVAGMEVHTEDPEGLGAFTIR